MRITSQGAVEQREGRNLDPSMTRWITAAVLPTAWTAPHNSDFERENYQPSILFKSLLFSSLLRLMNQ